MINWMKRRGVAAYWRRGAQAETRKPPARAMSGEYLLLYNYLDKRYANTVVLTFAEIEDLLGFVLPEQARLQQQWWTNVPLNAADHSDSWTLASRTAIPNLLAQTVSFARV